MLEFTMKGDCLLAKLGKLGFHVKGVAKKRFVYELDKKLGNSCTKILQVSYKNECILYIKQNKVQHSAFVQ